MKHYLFFLTSVLVLASCSEKKLVHPSDYNYAVTPNTVKKAVKSSAEEIHFWQERLAKDTGSFVNMLELGYNYLSLFKLKGRIEDLKKGDSLIKRASQKLNNTDPNILQALSQASI